MAPQSNLTGWVIGKRSRSPLAERSTNTRPKRSKPTPDLHPGGPSDENGLPFEVAAQHEEYTDGERADEERVDRERVDEQRADDEYIEDWDEDHRDEEFVEEDHIGEELAGEEDVEELAEEERVDDGDDDEERVNDGDDAKGGTDHAKADEQARLFGAWSRECEKNDPLGLTGEERQSRIERCHSRFLYMLEALARQAKGIEKKGYEEYETRVKLPLTLSWWSFFVSMAPDMVLGRLMASLPDSVKVILGGPLTNEELLMLPQKWEGCKLWGVYTDIFTKAAVDGDLTQPDVARYCGSGKSLEGVDRRLKMYVGYSNGTRKPEPGTHPRWLLRKDVQMNLRLIAVFDQCESHIPYVMLMEFLITILL